MDGVSVQHLDYGDLCFEGYGETGTCVVGCERKKLPDLVGSMQSKRLSGHQLRGLWDAYDYVFLFCEGIWKEGPGGEILQQGGANGWRPLYAPHSRMAVSFAQLNAYLDSLSLRSRHPHTGEPLRVKRTQGVGDTAAQYLSLYKGFQKPWADHHAHDQIYTPEPMVGGQSRRGRVGTIAAPVERVTTAWRCAAQLPGLDRKAFDVSKHFGTVREMATASEVEWCKIAGIGKKMAGKIVESLTTEGR